MPDEIRTCARTACRWPAAASLSFRYATKQVWLLDLIARREPSTYDLCPHHADSLTVPNGWERVDQRTRQPVVVEPAGRDLKGSYGPTVARLVEAGAGQDRGNRYAALWDELPRLAAEVAGSVPGGPHAGGAGGLRADQPERGVERGADRARERAGDGQLAIPVDDQDSGGVVVPINLAGARRRPVAD